MPTDLPDKLVCFTPGRVQRNDPCPCGSGLKYKNCCLRLLHKYNAQIADLTVAYNLNRLSVSFYLHPLVDGKVLP